jgi:outer membrane protein assembly factor BamB
MHTFRQYFAKKWRPLPLIALTLVVMVSGVLIELPHKQKAQAAASADWPTYLMNNSRKGFNGAETIINPTTAPHLKLHWTYKAGAAISTQPVEANRLIYWGSWDGYEHATHLGGSRAWATYLGTTTDSACLPPSVGVASTSTIASVVINGKATLVDFVGGGNGYFYALNASTGAVIWKTLLGSSPSHFLWSSPAFYNGSIYEGVSSFGDCPLVQGQLVQMNAITGAIQHTFNVVPNGCIGASVWGSPTIDATTGMIYFVTGNAGSCATSEPYSTALVEVRASDISLISAWQLPLAQRLPDSDFGTTPTLFNATIHGVWHQLVGVENKDGKYYAFDRTHIRKGPLWKATVSDAGECPQCGTGGISPSAWDGTKLYVASGSTTIQGSKCQGSLRALNPATGAFLWHYCMTSGPVLGAVTAVPGVVTVGQGAYLSVLNANTGKLLYSYRVTTSGELFYGAASISNGVLYIGHANGKLYAFGT